MADDNDAYVDPRAFSQAYGYLWLNSVFVVRQPRWRLWKRSSIRTSAVELIMVGISAFVIGAIVLGVSSVLALVPGLDQLIWPWALAVIAGPIFGWPTGRKLAKASPYRRLTGEGIGSYFAVQATNKSHLLGRIVGRTVATNTYTTWATGKRLPVLCVEWLGTARAPRAPKRPEPGSNVDRMDVYLKPRNFPTQWAGRTKDSARRASRR